MIYNAFPNRDWLRRWRNSCRSERAVARKCFSGCFTIAFNGGAITELLAKLRNNDFLWLIEDLLADPQSEFRCLGTRLHLCWFKNSGFVATKPARFATRYLARIIYQTVRRGKTALRDDAPLATICTGSQNGVATRTVPHTTSVGVCPGAGTRDIIVEYLDSTKSAHKITPRIPTPRHRPIPAVISWAFLRCSGRKRLSWQRVGIACPALPAFKMRSSSGILLQEFGRDRLYLESRRPGRTCWNSWRKRRRLPNRLTMP